jgi:hypothetical protein
MRPHSKPASRNVCLPIASLGIALGAAAVAGTGWIHAQTSSVTVSVDATANVHPISAMIYGTAYADATALADLNAQANRYGGNNSSRYNWQVNADNRDQDWFFESIGDTSATAGERGDTFISTSKSGGAQPLITIPMIGWVAKLGSNRAKLSSFSIAKYGAQTGHDQWFPDAGTGVLTNGQDVTGNDPNDANVPADSTYQAGWIQHLVGRWGQASSGGLRYYILDNEPSIWFATHRDVHPTGPTMDEIKSKLIDYAGKVKAADPSALVVGPEEWGWSGYFYSGFDQQYGSIHGWSNLPDRANHGGADYLPWVLDQLKQNQTSTGQRLLDVFSVHYYPQGGEFGNDTSTAMQLLRNQSTRSLWDPAYVDQSWINDKVQLIPRIRQWVSTHYPGTQTAVTEYNWGAESHINGATTQADILGIFGREGLDIGTRWTTPDPATPTYKAMKIYRNYDGNKSTFGDSSVQCAAPNPDAVSAFASLRTSDGALTSIVINKNLSGTATTTVNLAHYAAQSSAQIWQLTSANAITRLSNAAVSGGNSVTLVLPGQSITLLVFQPMQTSCAYGLSPSSANIPSGGGSGSTGVTAPSGCAWVATPSAAWISITSGSSGSGNGVIDFSVQANSGRRPRSAAIMVADQTFTVTEAGRGAETSDFDGDGKTDLGIWRPATGAWWTINSSTGSTTTKGWGMSGDIPVPGDYDGDGKVDLAVWRPSTGVWWIINSSDGSVTSRGWGLNGDIPVPGDYDGDGKTDFAIWRPSTGVWWIIKSSDGSMTATGWGLPNKGDVPVVGDYDGDGKTDLAIWRASTGVWWILNSSDGSVTSKGWGMSGDIPVKGDYDGDGKTDIAMWRPSSGIWWIMNSSDGSITAKGWGVSGDIPVPGDYDGDGKTDIAIWRPSTGTWWIVNSSTGNFLTRSWGVNGDVPAP